MLLASLARARPLARLIAPRLPRLYSTTPKIDPELRRNLEALRDSMTDPEERRELDQYLDTGLPPDESGEEIDEDVFNYPKEPQHASILSPEEIGSTSQDLFGSQERTTLQTLPDGFDTSQLPLPGPLGTNYTEIEYASTVVHGRSIHRPFRHPRTHSLPAAQIQFRSHDIISMNLFVHFATHAAYSLGIPCSRMYSLPTQRQLWTVLRGPFAHKKSQENFERKVHRRGLKAYDADPGVVDLWFKYLQRHAMGGVGMRCVKWERLSMGAGQQADSRVLGAINRSKQVSERIKSLGKKIVREEMGVADSKPPPDNIRTVSTQ